MKVRQSQNTTIMWWSLYYADDMYRAFGHFPTTVDSAYCSTPTRHGGVPTPTWQPSIQRFSTKCYLQSKVRNSLRATRPATDLHQAL